MDNTTATTDPFFLILMIIVAILYVLFKSLSRSSSSKGYIGEQRVGSKLDRFSGTNADYQTFHNVTLKTLDGSTQIDHILISPYGIFVIETKNLQGWIFGGENQKQWTQTLYKEKYRFQNPIHQNYKHVKALQRLLGTDIRIMFNIVVFAGDSKFKTEIPDNVVDLIDFIPLLKSYTGNVVNNENIEKYSALINDTITNSPITEREHVNNLRENANNPICPRCGKPMALRTARKGSKAGSQFWGCTGFPSCKATKVLD